MLLTPFSLSPAHLALSAPLASLTLGVPLMAWGLLAGLVPIIIHLVLRERARREVFPAMRLLVQAHLSTTRNQRLRHFLLLLARVCVICLAVVMLGRLGCTRPGGTGSLAAISGTSPASVVFCIDNSASMGYRFQGRTRVQAAVDRARALLDDNRLFGPGSQFAVVTGTPSPGMGSWHEDRRATRRLLDTVRPAAHNLGAARLLGNAYGLLSAARHPRREVYLFNDLTEASWSQESVPAPQSLTALLIIDVGQDENRNVALGWPQVPAYALPSNVPIELPLRIQAGDFNVEPVLEFSIDGTPRGRQTGNPLAPASQAEIKLSLPGLAPGAHALAITLEPGDALAADNQRFAWLIAGDLPRVALLTDTPDNPVARMLRAMIAPPVLLTSQQHYAVEPILLAGLLERPLDPMLAVIVADVQSLNGLAWEKLAAYARSGGTLLFVPGPSVTPASFDAPAGLLPATVKDITDHDPPLRPAVANLSHPYLLAFADITIDSLNDRHAFKRLAAEPAPPATTVFTFNDGSPAMLETRFGKGRSILLTFSPAASWGQFGTQAAPTIVLLHRLLDTVRPPLKNLAAYPAGAAAMPEIGQGSAPLLVRSQQGSETVSLPAAGSKYRLPTDDPQLYSAAEKSNPKAPLLYYSVNVAEPESQPIRIPGDMLKSRFDYGPVRLVGPTDEISPQDPAGPARVNWTVPLGVALILLLLIESSFGNGFYRSSRP